MKENVLKSINFHFWPKCNFKCRYCFARFKNLRSILTKKDCLYIIQSLQNAGVEKINFAGGEPTLSPYLGSLIKYAKSQGVITSLISNGTGINKEFLKKNGKHIDWIGLSIDSGDDLINKKLGRGKGNLVQKIKKKSKLIKSAGINLKINTVVSKLNYREDMSCLIEELKPERWKVFQVLEIKNQNHFSLKELLISNFEFEIFAKKHKNLSPTIECNKLMLNSYLMIDPLGRFYQNTEYSYNFSRPILKVGLDKALNDIYYDPIKLIERGGIYVW